MIVYSVILQIEGLKWHAKKKDDFKNNDVDANWILFSQFAFIKTSQWEFICVILLHTYMSGGLEVTVIVGGYGIDDSSSNPRWGC